MWFEKSGYKLLQNLWDLGVFMTLAVRRDEQCWRNTRTLCTNTLRVIDLKNPQWSY